VESKSTSTAP